MNSLEIFEHLLAQVLLVPAVDDHGGPGEHLGDGGPLDQGHGAQQGGLVGPVAVLAVACVNFLKS